ncbi:uncharacterized protein LOC120632729 [Pararge aegeria]|uniref:uncharacterized protein LOC120632729 n=1 Tax=Pararge aegeria TaxID=116150 RepID=UPI0019D08615|nr:uncharacterized protein LOC120632729 [Pararge aegeria]
MSEVNQISPWYNTVEWNKVYNNIFEPTSSLTTKQNALDQIIIWKARCPALPSGIEATMSLLNVYIQDQGQNHDIFNDHILRLAYSSALMRFVNHMFDKETAKGLSLFQAAKTFGVPEWIIELRHDTAHSNKLPQLELLREACVLSLNWLQINYWNKHKSCITDYIIGKVHNETETDKKITALMSFCVSLSICSHPSCKLKTLADITSKNLREYLVNDARHLFEDSLNFSNLNIGIAKLWSAMNNKAKKILNNESSSSYVNKALLSDGSAFLSLDMYKHLDNFGYTNNRPLKTNYVQSFSGLLHFLMTNDLLRDFLLELIKITQGENEKCVNKCKLAAKWVFIILEALRKNQQFMEKINTTDIDMSLKNETEINNLYYHWFPNDKKRAIFLDLRKPVPKEFTNINFIQPIISTYNSYLVFFVKELLSLVRPIIPDSVKVKICQLAKVIASPEKFAVLSSKIYTADDLQISNNSESINESKDNEDIEIIEVQIEGKKNDDTTQKFGIWQNASKNADWMTCPIGQLPWTQTVEDMEIQ